MASLSKKSELKNKRKARGRKNIEGTIERPRLSVFKSSRHIYAQVIDDLQGHTLVSISSYKKGGTERADTEKCAELGKELAAKCKAKNVAKVVFDKNGNTYHGRVKALADGARAGGLDF